MNIIGRDARCNKIINTCKVRGKLKEDNNSNVCKNMLVCRLKSYAEEFVPIIDDRYESHTKYKKW